MLEAPQLSIVICNSDGVADTMACIDSIYAHPPAGSFEIVLVDNASRDGCVQQVGRQFPEVCVRVAPHRQGFAKNYNLGIDAARGDYILVLNNDTVVCQGALQALLDAMGRNPGYGMAGPRLIGADGRTQANCVRPLPTIASYIMQQLLLDPGLPLGRAWEALARWRLSRRRGGQVASISGACMLVSRHALAAVGPLDDAYTFYYEDSDWCRRVQRAGLEIGYVPEAQIIHLGGQSSRHVKVWARQQEYLSAVRSFTHAPQAAPMVRRVIRGATLAGWMIRGLGFVVAEAMNARPTYARHYLYLWHWLLRQPSASDTAV